MEGVIPPPVASFGWRLSNSACVSSAHAGLLGFEGERAMHMATTTKQWTLEELHSLPDDGNKYELVHGELFVTPAPSEDHETILASLSHALDSYVAANELGAVYRPRAVVRFDGSEVEPDLMVRAKRRAPAKDWDDAPTPILVVEVISGSTRRRDQVQKRGFYLEVGVAEYWIVDPERREIRVVRRGEPDVVATGELTWSPAGAGSPLVLRVSELFGDE
jgi:Uma2 family endonuclease